MHKIIGFYISRHNRRTPPWIGRYPWLTVAFIELHGWSIALWGHGDLSKFVDGDKIIVGYSDTELGTLPELHNRSVKILVDADDVRIWNDALGGFQVFYSYRAVSSDESLVVHDLPYFAGLDEGGVASFLMFQCVVGKQTVWRGVYKLYANSVLTVGRNGFASQGRMGWLNVTNIREETTKDFVAKIRCRLEMVARRYTDPLGEIVVPLSQGYDSRLLASFIRRPERITARTYALSQAGSLDCDVAIGRLIAADRGITRHKVMSFDGDYSPYIPDFLLHMGATVSAAQAYLYGGARLLTHQAAGPIISGAIGDALAGRGAGLTRTHLESGIGPAERFQKACHCHAHEWKAIHLDSWLNYDWRAAIEPLQKEWATIWEETEITDWELSRAILIRLRNRCSSYITGPWALADLWSGIVTPYYDRDYVTFMLSIPPKMLYRRIAQQRLLEWDWPDTWPHGGHEAPKSLTWRGTLVPDTITGNPKAFHPIEPSGFAHPFFNNDAIRALFTTAIVGNVADWGLLAPIQAIASAIKEYENV